MLRRCVRCDEQKGDPVPWLVIYVIDGSPFNVSPFIYITVAKLLQCGLVFAVSLGCSQARGAA